MLGGKRSMERQAAAGAETRRVSHRPHDTDVLAASASGLLPPRGAVTGIEPRCQPGVGGFYPLGHSLQRRRPPPCGPDPRIHQDFPAEPRLSLRSHDRACRAAQRPVQDPTRPGPIPHAELSRRLPTPRYPRVSQIPVLIARSARNGHGRPELARRL